MDNNPKRRKSKDNPYTIYIIDNKYIVEFKDGMGVIQKVDVSKDVYESFDRFELIDKKQMNEFERHIASYDLSDEYINKNKTIKSQSTEEEFIMKTTFKELRDAIEMLSETQKRRLKMYYFEQFNLEKIAKIEGCSIHSVFVGIKRAEEKIKKIIN